MFCLGSVEDLSFETNFERVLGPISNPKCEIGIGLTFRLPKQILRLEKGSPPNFWWLQGFGMEKIQIEENQEIRRFFPIWKFQSANKYYPSEYQGIQFVAGVKKQFQCSIEGIEQCLTLETIQDLNTLERTPVHEVVDLDDESDAEADLAEDSDKDDLEEDDP